MKNKAFISLLLVNLIFLSCKQEVNAQAPDAVKETFQKKYPGEDDPDWHQDDHGNYESNFKIDGIKYRADFNADGSWIETETSIDEDDLPKAIREAIERDYEDSEISEIEKVDHHSKGIFYDVEFKQKGKNMDVEYKASGAVIN